MDEFKWIEEESKINEIKDFSISMEPIASIKVHFVYINMDSCIEEQVIQIVELEPMETFSVLSKERFLYLIQNHKIHTPTTRYKFMNSLLYNIDILPSYLQQYILEESTGSGDYLKDISIVDDIRIPASLPIFHSLQSLYLFFQEKPLNGGGKTVKVKPILRIVDPSVTPSNENSNSSRAAVVKEKKTKRVRIQEMLNQSKKKRP